MRRFARDWWLVILFGGTCVFTAHQIVALKRDDVAARRDLGQCQAELGEYQKQSVRDLAAAVENWADGGAPSWHDEAARDMERLMNSGF